MQNKKSPDKWGLNGRPSREIDYSSYETLCDCIGKKMGDGKVRRRQGEREHER